MALLTAQAAHAEPRTLRIATVAPEGTAWAREVNALGREVESETGGLLRLKWYFGGIAGDELEAAARMERGQLDGVLSGGMLCERVSPTLRVARVIGVFQTRGEVLHVLQQLRPRIEREMEQAGLVNLGMGALGATYLFSRRPVRTWAEVRGLNAWRWNLDDVALEIGRHMGITATPLSFADATRSYEEGRVDGFYIIPTAALSWQLSAHARYVLDLPMDYIVGCLVVSSRAFNRLPYAAQQVLRASSAKTALRIHDVSSQQEDALLHGGFARQGVQPLPASDQLRGAFFSAARDARSKVLGTLISRPLLEEVLGLLAEYRAEHRRGDD